MDATQRRTGMLFGILAASIWGGMYVASKVVLEVVPPFTLLTLRLVLGIASLALWMRLRKQPWPALAPRQWLHLATLGVTGYGISLGLQFAGTHLSTAANGAIITSLTPAIVFVFARLVLKEPAGRRELFVLLVSIVSIWLILDPRQADLSREMATGNLLLVGAALTWAAYSIRVRQLAAEVDVYPLTVIALTAGLLVAVPMSARELHQSSLPVLSANIWLGIAYLGVVSTAVAAYLWNKAFALLPARTASLTFFAQPLVGAILGIALLGERFTPQFAWGAALILLCLWVASQSDKIT
ncbi:MAG: DMT family transporter [Anaerolineales bacterium]|nr:DMT family transporter [Anaerolineales bacterium]